MIADFFKGNVQEVEEKSKGVRAGERRLSRSFKCHRFAHFGALAKLKNLLDSF